MSENRYEGLNGAGDKFSKIAGRAGDTAEKIGYAGGAPSLFAEGTVESALNEASDKLKAVFGGTNSSGEFYDQTKYYKTNDICVDKNTGKAYRFKASDSSVHVAPNATGGGNYWEEVSLSILSSKLTEELANSYKKGYFLTPFILEPNKKWYFAIVNFPVEAKDNNYTININTQMQGGMIVDLSKINIDKRTSGIRLYTQEASYVGGIINLTVS